MRRGRTSRSAYAADLQQSITDLTSRGFPAPTLFAYPFSDVVEDGSNAKDTVAVSRVLDELFVASFVDANLGTSPVSQREASRQLLERLEVTAADTDRSLFDEIAAMDSLPVSSMSPLECLDDLAQRRTALRRRSSAATR